MSIFALRRWQSNLDFSLMFCSAYFSVLLIHPNNYSFLCMKHPYDLCFFSVLKTNLCFLRLLGGTLTLILLCLYALKSWRFVWFRISRAWLRILRSAWPSLLGGIFFFPSTIVSNSQNFFWVPASVCFLCLTSNTHTQFLSLFFFPLLFWPYYLPVMWGCSTIKNIHPTLASFYFESVSFAWLRSNIWLCQKSRT